VLRGRLPLELGGFDPIGLFEKSNVLAPCEGGGGEEWKGG
jgi:hypothetical protein